MNKVKTILIIACMFLGVAIHLEAGQCSGGTPIYYCSTQTLADAIADADLNCCEGSEIVLINCATGASYHHYVEQDGPSSSCAFE